MPSIESLSQEPILMKSSNVFKLAVCRSACTHRSLLTQLRGDGACAIHDLARSGINAAGFFFQAGAF